MRLQTPSSEGNGFFERRDPWGHRLSLWVFSLLLFLAPLALASLLDLRLDNAVENWLPKRDAQAEIFRWCRNHFPEKEQIVLTWAGSTVDDPRTPVLSARLLGRLDSDGVRRDGLPYVESVVTARDILEKMTGYGVEPDQAIARAQGTIVGRGWVKVLLTAAGRQESERTIGEIVRRAKKELGLDLQIHERAVCWQPPLALEDEFIELADRWLPSSGTDGPEHSGENGAADWEGHQFSPHDLQVGWGGMAGDPERIERVLEWLGEFRGFATAEEPGGRKLVERAFIQSGSPVAMIVSLSEAGVADRSAALKAIREAAEECFISPDALMLGGRAVAGAALNEAVIKAAWNPSSTGFFGRSVIGFSGLVGIAFALLSLKSLRLGLLVIGISYYTALVGLSLVPLSGGSMNLVLVVMPTLLMVISLSGAIHVANYWKHASWEQSANPVSAAIRMARRPCFMSAFTTALGLISLATSDLLPVRQFGIYSSIGTMISVALVLYGLPTLLQMTPLRRVRPSEVNSDAWNRYGEFLCRRGRLVKAVCIVAALACSFGLHRFQTETKVIRYFPENSRLVSDYQQIEDTLTGISPIEVVVRFSQQAQQEYRFLERMEIVRKIENELREHREISGVVALPDFQPVQLPPGPDARTRDKIFYNRRSNETERRIKELQEGGASEFLDVATEAESSGGRKLSEVGDELWRLNLQAAVLSDSDYSQLTADLDERIRSVAKFYPGTDHVVTGTVPLFLRTQQAVLDGLITSFAQAFVLILIVMMFMLRDPLAGLLSMVPNVLPVSVVFGIASYLGQKIDIGTMVTASIALGIAVDNTLHMCTWFVSGLQKGKSREEATLCALSHCGPASLQTSAAISIAMLVLVPSDLLLISKFGWLMAALIAAATIGDVVLLPTMLLGILGWVIEKRTLRQLGNEQSAHTDAPEETSRPSALDTVIPAPHIPLKGIPKEPSHAGQAR